ncbi:hypothetical protein AGABI2DRAFT_142196 [Agaricus bisporus var. bisporus H97]|uniref:hypothetical protein n=1 Tax=Agaricus bisporus var. bisporus (strain H97 / ATCC MYA-4626 / FGSC 10389) TaxID=936046 RepID=UPI00029F7CEA|nr:hypothetical protein AGABI2DRAFT_142196 [Agaricus bisporus var. bisporus H97]EKV47886.1 hypothetical protein AGABI2DRAFT_142196 [Agaricus bisporus var. bisporus H97]
MSMSPDLEFLKSVVIDRRGPETSSLRDLDRADVKKSADDFVVDLYYIAFPNDKKITKAIVAFVYSIDTAQTFLALYDFYQSFCVNKYSFILNQDNTTHLWLTIPFTGTLSMYCDHTTTIFFLGIPLNSSILIYTNLTVYYGWGSVGMVCDLVIAVYMSWFLTKQMRRSPSRKTQVMVTRIKRLVLETGLLTASVPRAQCNPAAAFAATFTVLLVLTGHYATFAIPGLTLGKLYSNSILVLLNNRFTIEGGRNEPAFEFEADSYHLSDLPTRREGAEHGIRE